jgi:hypothetical protein
VAGVEFARTLGNFRREGTPSANSISIQVGALEQKMTKVFPDKFKKTSLRQEDLILPYKEAKEALQWCFENKVEIRGWEGCFAYRHTVAPADLPAHHTFPDGSKISGIGPSREIIGANSFGPEAKQEQIYQTCLKTIEDIHKEYASNPKMKDISLYYWLLLG